MKTSKQSSTFLFFAGCYEYCNVHKSMFIFFLEISNVHKHNVHYFLKYFNVHKNDVHEFSKILWTLSFLMFTKKKPMGEGGRASETEGRGGQRGETQGRGSKEGRGERECGSRVHLTTTPLARHLPRSGGNEQHTSLPKKFLWFVL